MAPVTIDDLAEALYQDFLAALIRQVSLGSLTRHRTLAEWNQGPSPRLIQSATKDIYGQDRAKLKTSEASRYFECGSCGRKIAGQRFASHINKCLDRR